MHKRFNEWLDKNMPLNGKELPINCEEAESSGISYGMSRQWLQNQRWMERARFAQREKHRKQKESD